MQDRRNPLNLLILSVSDNFGKEDKTDLLSEFSDAEIHDYLYEPCPDCDGEGCEECYDSGSIDLDPLLSLYSVAADDWNNREETGFDNAHSTHWLSRYGDELDVGNFI